MLYRLDKNSIIHNIDIAHHSKIIIYSKSMIIFDDYINMRSNFTVSAATIKHEAAQTQHSCTHYISLPDLQLQGDAEELHVH